MTNHTKPISGEAWKWIVLILFLAFASLMFHLKLGSFDNTTLAFIGVPAVLAATLALAGTPTTLEGRYIKATTLGLLLIGILAAEKFAFLLIIAPLAWLLAYFRAQSDQQRIRERAAAEPARAASQSSAGASGEAERAATQARATATAEQSPASPPAEAVAFPTSPLPGHPAPATRMPQQESDRVRRKKLTLIGICLTFTFISIAGRIIYAQHLETTSLMFIGVPAALAILLALTVRPKSAMATAMTGITFVLLLSAILFGEGLICILMAAPIFYVAGAIVAALWEGSRTKPRTTRLMLATPLLLMSLEGSHQQISLPRQQTVTAHAIVAASTREVESALAAPMCFHTALPMYLRMGFPRPVATSGSGLAPGSLHVIHFAGGEGKPGDLVMQVDEVGADRIVFRAVSDHSKLAHWLDWEDAVVTWRPIDDHQTEVFWTLRYRRNLDPAWYFGPWERYGVGLAGKYLIENLATPLQ
jgi:hypothetical protein